MHTIYLATENGLKSNSRAGDRRHAASQVHQVDVPAFVEQCRTPWLERRSCSGRPPDLRVMRRSCRPRTGLTAFTLAAGVYTGTRRKNKEVRGGSQGLQHGHGSHRVLYCDHGSGERRLWRLRRPDEHHGVEVHRCHRFRRPGISLRILRLVWPFCDVPLPRGLISDRPRPDGPRTHATRVISPTRGRQRNRKPQWTRAPWRRGLPMLPRSTTCLPFIYLTPATATRRTPRIRGQNASRRDVWCRRAPTIVLGRLIAVQPRGYCPRAFPLDGTQRPSRRSGRPSSRRRRVR